MGSTTTLALSQSSFDHLGSRTPYVWGEPAFRLIPSFIFTRWNSLWLEQSLHWSPALSLDWLPYSSHLCGQTLSSLLFPLSLWNSCRAFLRSLAVWYLRLKSHSTILLGILRNSHCSEDTSPLGILQYIGDFDNVSAVLDLTARDIFVLSKHSNVKNIFFFHPSY